MAVDWFDQLYRASYRRLVLIALSNTRDLAEAEEIVQEAFARGFARRRTLAAADNKEAWLTTVTLNLARRNWRRKNRETSQLADRSISPTEGSIARLDLWQALARIPSDQREAIVLHHLADMPQNEIAERLGVAVGTVKSRVSRGRAALAAVLADGDPLIEGDFR